MRQERDKVIPLHVSRELRVAFSSLGQSLPKLWGQPSLRRAQRKALLRCLIDKVVVHRKARDQVATRIVWRGGQTTETIIPIHVGSVRELSNFPQMEAQILALESNGKTDAEIARLLTGQGFRSPLRQEVLESTVKAIRLKHRRFHRFKAPRPRKVSGQLTLPQLAQRLGVTAHWLYYLIKQGTVRIRRDPKSKLYLFPDHPKTLEDFRQLKEGCVQTLCY